jgi:hypothetical protein
VCWHKSKHETHEPTTKKGIDFNEKKIKFNSGFCYGVFKVLGKSEEITSLDKKELTVARQNGKI